MMKLSCAPLSEAILEERALKERAPDDSVLHLPFEKIPVSFGKSWLNGFAARETMLLQWLSKKVGAVAVAKQHGEA
jgi:hypothetical protein